MAKIDYTETDESILQYKITAALNALRSTTHNSFERSRLAELAQEAFNKTSGGNAVAGFFMGSANLQLGQLFRREKVWCDVHNCKMCKGS